MPAPGAWVARGANASAPEGGTPASNARTTKNVTNVSLASLLNSRGALQYHCSYACFRTM
eukprot:3991670-Lingulodinium_polyedra.AAC.1